MSSREEFVGDHATRLSYGFDLGGHLDARLGDHLPKHALKYKIAGAHDPRGTRVVSPLHGKFRLRVPSTDHRSQDSAAHRKRLLSLGFGSLHVSLLPNHT